MSYIVSQEEANNFFDRLNESGGINRDHSVPAYTYLADSTGISLIDARRLFLNWADKKFSDLED